MSATNTLFISCKLASKYFTYKKSVLRAFLVKSACKYVFCRIKLSKWTKKSLAKI
jgi:hypothetical protein